MEGLAPLSSSPSAYQQTIQRTSIKASFEFDAVVVSTSLAAPGDSVSIGGGQVAQGLALTAQQIVDALNEKLKSVLPQGVQSLKPEEVTPEATADRIVKGVTALFDIFAKRHGNLEAEDLLASFMDTIRSGVDQGFDDAVGILEGLGAFQFEGVKEGVYKTKDLIEQKLAAYEKQKRIELGIDSADPEQAQVSGNVSNSLLTQAGGNISVVA